MGTENNPAQEKNIIAATIILEAAGEGADGMRAVANVILNRSIRSHRLAVSEVQLPRQFAYSKFEDPIPRAKSIAGDQWSVAEQLAEKVLSGFLDDNTRGSTHFHSGPKPGWATRLTFTCKIGNHYFYR